LSDSDPRAADRQDVCQFADDRLSDAQRLAFVHRLLDREAAETRMFLDRIERYSASLSETQRQTPAVARELEAIAGDGHARARYLDFARDADQPAVRARMIALAGRLGWLSSAEQRTELMQMIGDRVAKNAVSPGDVDLVCTLNKDDALDDELDRLQLSPAQANQVPYAALRACLGSSDARARVMLALTSPIEDEVQVAQVYLRHRPITDVNELRLLTAGIARMNNTRAQIRALETLASQRLSDADSLDELTRLFPLAESVGVQTAIAGVLIRSDYQAIATPEFVQKLRQSRLKTSGGADLIDVLIRRLQAE
jgi:hypothetical protein